MEFGEGATGYLQTTEWPFYIFDALLVLVTMVIFNIIHPGKYLVDDVTTPGNNSINTNKIQVIEMPAVSAKMG